MAKWLWVLLTPFRLLLSQGQRVPIDVKKTGASRNRVRGFAFQRRAPGEPTQVPPPPSSLRFAATSGFDFLEDLKGSPKLLALSRAAAEDLWRFYGLGWVPGEYWALFEQHHDPVAVFRYFCSLFGVDVQNIRFRQKAEIDLLQQVVSILLELGLIKGQLPEENRDRILEAMRQKDHPRAEELLAIAQTMLLAMRDSLGLVGVVEFAGCKKYLRDLDACKSDLLQVSLDEAKDALWMSQNLPDAWGKYLYFQRVIGEVVGWIEGNWPQGTQWAADNDQGVNNMVVAEEAVLGRLLDDEEADLFGDVVLLEQLHVDLVSVMNQISAVHGSSAGTQQQQQGGVYRGTHEEKLAQWQKALALFNFPPDAVPSEKEVQAKFRPLAKEHHPDRWPPTDHPAEVVAEHTRIFIEASDAWEVLKRGKPQG